MNYFKASFCLLFVFPLIATAGTYQDHELEKDDLKKDIKTEKLVDEGTGYYIEHRFGLAFGLSYINEVQNIQVLKTDPGFILPVLQYDLVYRTRGDVNVPSWETKFFVELSHMLKPSNGVELPFFNGKFELGFARHSLFKFGTTSFSPYLGLRVSFDSSVTADASRSKSARRLGAFLIGIRPEFTSYVSGTRVEYSLSFYKSLYGKSIGERFGGYEFGLRTDVGIALDNALTSFVEYTYDSYGNSSDTVDLSWHSLILGLGYRF